MRSPPAAGSVGLEDGAHMRMSSPPAAGQPWTPGPAAAGLPSWHAEPAFA